MPKIIEKYGMVFNCKKVDPDMCEGCFKVLEDGHCECYEDPNVWVRRGGCPVKVTKEFQIKGQKGKKVNPIKASKRRFR